MNDTLPPSAPSGYGTHGGFSPEMPADVEQRASCIVQIDGVGAGLPSFSYESRQGPRFDPATVSGLLSSTVLSEPVVQATLKLKPGAVGRQVLIAAAPSGRFLRLEVCLKKAEKPWPDDAANRLLVALVERVRVAAKESKKAEDAARMSRLVAMKEELAALQTRRQEVGESLQSVRAVLGQENWGDVTGAVRTLKMQKTQLEAELANLKTQLATMESDAVTLGDAEVKSAEKTLAKLTRGVKRGEADVDAVADAATKLAEAKAKLAAAKAAAGPGSMRHQGHQVDAMRAMIAEREARLKSFNERLAKLASPAMAAKLVAYGDEQREEQRMQNEIAVLADRLRGLQSAMRDRTPSTFTILDGNPVPEVEKSK
ncbi:MAG: hypothetical protein ABFC96_13965 [Thermoguttaceae bacterium]